MATDDAAKHAWVARVLGVHVQGADPSGVDMGEDPLDLKNRLADATRKLSALKAEGDPALPALLNVHGLATTAFKAKAPTAGELMDDLERELARALSAARGRKAAAENAGVVEYAKMLLRWENAQSRVLTNLNDLGAALLAVPDMEQREDYAEIVDAVYELPELIPDFGFDLDEVLNAARKPGADRASLNREALDIIASYRSEIESVSELKALQGFSAQLSTGQVDLFDELKAALDEIETEMSKAA